MKLNQIFLVVLMMAIVFFGLKSNADVVTNGTLPFGNSESGLPFGNSESGLPFGNSESGLPFGNSESDLPPCPVQAFPPMSFNSTPNSTTIVCPGGQKRVSAVCNGTGDQCTWQPVSGIGAFSATLVCQSNGPNHDVDNIILVCDSTGTPGPARINGDSNHVCSWPSTGVYSNSLCNALKAACTGYAMPSWCDAYKN